MSIIRILHHKKYKYQIIKTMSYIPQLLVVLFLALMVFTPPAFAEYHSKKPSVYEPQIRGAAPPSTPDPVPVVSKPLNESPKQTLSPHQYPPSPVHKSGFKEEPGCKKALYVRCP